MKKFIYNFPSFHLTLFLSNLCILNSSSQTNNYTPDYFWNTSLASDIFSSLTEITVPPDIFDTIKLFNCASPSQLCICLTVMKTLLTNFSNPSSPYSLKYVFPLPYFLIERNISYCSVLLIIFQYCMIISFSMLSQRKPGYCLEKTFLPLDFHLINSNRPYGYGGRIVSLQYSSTLY